MQRGDRIRDYVLEELIGEGVMGQVWRALHVTLDRHVAIKAISPYLSADPEFRERFALEAKRQASMHHAYILGVTDFFEDGGISYLVMPLVRGQSLEARLRAAGGP